MGFKKEFRSETSDLRWATNHLLLRFVVPVVVVVFLVLLAFKPFGFGFGVLNRVVDADAAISNYEWYESQYQDIRAVTSQLEDARAAVQRFRREAGPREKWTYDDRQESARLAVVAAGLEQERKHRIAVYNARSRMITRNLWKPRDGLPQQISLEEEQ
jgi:hypothetical protein